MTTINNNLVSTAKIYSENKYAEFTTLFRIPFNDVDPSTIFTGKTDRWKEILSAWSEICVRALELRMDSCVAMLFRNRNNVVISNECQIIFKKNNGHYHAFNHPSFNAMERMIKQFQSRDWESIRYDEQGVRQLLKALYWISEDDRKDHGGFGFGQLISCLEEFTFGNINP